jgi:glycosyltransferase involved in cell wall biosynthesis
MNILYYLGTFPKISESFILNEIYELEKRGHNVVVFAINQPEEDIEHQEYNEIDIPVCYANPLNYIDVINLLSPKILRPRILQNAKFIASVKIHFAAFNWSKQCIEFIEELDLDVDLIHSHFTTVSRFSGRYVASYYNIPFTMTAHAFDLYNSPNKEQLEHIVSKIDHLVTISEYNKNYVRDEISEKTPNTVVHAGIRPEKFEPGSSSVDQRILTVSRFVEKKGIPYAINAVSKIVDDYSSLRYHIIGSGEMESEIENQIEELRLADTVELLGNVTDKRLIAELDEASCFLLPCIVADSGDQDGIPVSLMEAMAMETPPISTNVSGIPELIDDRLNGFTVEPKNTDELAEAISSMLGSPEKQRRFGTHGRKKVINEFNIEKEAVKLESVFEQTANQC